MPRPVGKRTPLGEGLRHIYDGDMEIITDIIFRNDRDDEGKFRKWAMCPGDKNRKDDYFYQSGKVVRLALCDERGYLQYFIMPYDPDLPQPFYTERGLMYRIHADELYLANDPRVNRGTAADRRDPMVGPFGGLPYEQG
jgi:hypothetical protein